MWNEYYAVRYIEETGRQNVLRIDIFRAMSEEQIIGAIEEMDSFEKWPLTEPAYCVNQATLHQLDKTIPREVTDVRGREVDA